MAIAGWNTAENLRLALSTVTYMAIFDDDRTKDPAVVDASPQVLQVLALSASEVASYLPAVFAVEDVPQLPDAVSQILAGAQLYYARVLSYQRRPEYVKTYGAQTDGPMEKRFVEKMLRIQASVQQIPEASGEGGPSEDPPNVGASVRSDVARMIINDADGTDNLGDF